MSRGSIADGLAASRPARPTPGERADLYLGEGDTPLIALPRLAARWGLTGLWAKAEYLNPTGSYKDRIAAATMRAALEQGSRGWVGTSSGNGGAAMSAYGRRAGLPGALCVLADAPPQKLASIRPYRVLLITLPQMGPDVMPELSRIATAENLMLTITAHAYNPVGMRGADGIGAEIAAERPEVTHLYIPAGGGGLLVATARGAAEAGLLAQVVAAQPAGCAPIVRYLRGEVGRPVIARWSTGISGLQLPAPPDGEAAAAMVSASGGWGADVPDEDAWRAQDELARAEGIFVEPASALALAAIRRDVLAGRVGRSDQPCVVLTGTGLKDLRRYAATDAAEGHLAVGDLHRRIRDHMAAEAE